MPAWYLSINERRTPFCFGIHPTTYRGGGILPDGYDKSYVLCPANWFQLPNLKQMELMIQNAVRFVASVDDSDLTEIAQIVKDMVSELSPECIRRLLAIIKGKAANSANQEWEELRHALEAALPATEKR